MTPLWNNMRPLARPWLLVPLALVFTLSLMNLLSGQTEADLPPESMFYLGAIDVGGAELSMNRVDHFSDRPLFSPSRRPEELIDVNPAQEETLSGVPLEKLDGWTLLGIFDSGEVRGAIIRLQDGTQRRLVLGQNIGGWILESLDARGARLKSPTGGARAVLNLDLAAVTEQVSESAEVIEQNSEITEPPEPQDSILETPDSDSGKEAAPPRRRGFGEIYGDRDVPRAPGAQ